MGFWLIIILPNLAGLLHRSFSKPQTNMPYLKSTLIAIVLIIILSCCKKPAKDTFLVLSKEEISLEEPLIAKVVDAPAGARYEWQIPYGVPVLQYAKDSSMVKLAFARAIDAMDPICVKVFSGSDTVYTDCRNVHVDTATFNPDANGNSVHEIIAGDQLTIQPILYSTDSSLGFIMKTSKSYSCLNSYILNNGSSTYNSVFLSFGDVWFSKDCEPVNMPVTSYYTTHHYYRDGTYPFSIYFDNKLYTGSFTVSKFQGKFEFNWPYTTVVLI
jgi:hypothetical protein